MSVKEITHIEFVDQYKKRLLKVYIDRNMAGDFVMSRYADKHNKPAHIFWSWTGILLTFVFPIILLFVNWVYSILCVISGLMIASASRKSAEQFVLGNMLKDEEFWNYILLYRGAKIVDLEGNELKSSWLEKMGETYGKPNQ